METQKRDNRRCSFCNIDVHRASYMSHLKIKKKLGNEKFIPINFFNEANESNKSNQKNYSPKPLKGRARGKFNINIRIKYKMINN